MNASLPNIDALGESESWLDFQERLSRSAAVDRPVLLIGERGSGKELAARRLHYLSARWSEPLVALNCAALASTLIESELFGYEPGAFTGAGARRRGRFESAEGGTLFLDELGNIPVEVQEKILRVVEYGVFERVGGSEAVQVDVRIIGATNTDLPARAAAGRFMSDLLDRLSFEVLYLPPLRARQGDVSLLANHFAARMAAELGRRDIPRFTDAAQAQLEAHPWPGNVRELKNVVERAVYRAKGAVISELCFDPFVCPYPALSETASAPADAPAAPSDTPDTAPPADFRAAVENYEARLVRQALHAAQYNQRKAAQKLGLTYHQFRGLYRKYSEHLNP
ncbi:MAG TPA: phage shock protein operon transcriptional activator [Candidatus Hydrogenedentes bacterium]|nr:phage shock protein operon transcriptional activator [Candidatus Hydrogenedentota bacterium]